MITRKSDTLNTQNYRLSRYQSRKTHQPLDYYTGDSSSNGDEQCERTRAMAKYNTDCDSSEVEDGLEYYDSSSNESGESMNRQSTREKEDVFFSFSGNSNPLRIHDFFQVGKSMGISITHLVIYGGFSIPRPIIWKQAEGTPRDGKPSINN